MWKKDEERFPSPANHVLIFLAIALLGFFLYSPALQGEFVSDDYVFIVDNPAIRSDVNFPQVWSSFPTRFLAMLSFAGNYHLGGLQVFGYHLVNVLLHVGNAILVYLLIVLVCGSSAFSKVNSARSQTIAVLSALIFLTHPLQTQAVSFISQRTALLGAFFYLGTLVSYAVARRKKHKGLFYVSLLAMGLGVFSKEMIVTAPVMILCYEVFFAEDWRRNWQELLVRLAPFFLLAAMIPVILLAQRPTLFNFNEQLAQGSFSWEYFLTEVNVLRTYLRLFLFPLNQNYVYDYPLAETAFAPMTTYSILLHAGLILLSGILFNRNRLVSFAILWFYLTSSIEAATVTFVHREVIFEHWLYLPMVGLALGAAAVLPQGITLRQKACFGLCGVSILALMTLTFQRNQVWRHEISFWEDVVKKSHRKPTVYLGLGSAYLHRGEEEKAFETLQRGLALYGGERKNPSAMERKFLVKVYNNLGVISGNRRDFVRAREYFRQAMVYQPDYGPVYHNLGQVYLSLGQYSQASISFERSLQLQGDYWDGDFYLAVSCLSQGDSLKAKFLAQKALVLAQQQSDAQKEKDTQELLMLINKR
jgi:protein O-mannosyl-transferase